MESELHFEVIDKLVDLGEDQVRARFQETMADVEKARTDQFTPEQHEDLDAVLEAYREAERLVINLIVAADSIKLQMANRGPGAMR